MRAAVLVAAVAAGGCVPAGSGAAQLSGPRNPLDAYPSSSTQVHAAPPEPPLVRPWKVGDWTAYQYSRPGAAATVLVIRIAAEDACGTWVDFEEDDGTDQRGTRVCLTRTLNADGTSTVDAARVIVKREKDDITRVDELDASSNEGARWVKLLSQTWSGRRGIPRKDTTTPAGTFVAALEVTGAAPGDTTWAHPEVPITGVVKSVLGGDELALLDYGPSTAAVAVAQRKPGAKSAVLADQKELLGYARWERRLEAARRKWVAFTFGSETYGTLDDTVFTPSLGALFGYFVRPSLSLVLDMSGTQPTEYAPRPTVSEQYSQYAVGVRWYPYARPTHVWRGLAFDTKSVYVQAELGYADVRRSAREVDYGTVGRGGVAGVRLGINIGMSRDWRMALELHEHTALLNGDEGVRIMAGLRANIELFLP